MKHRPLSRLLSYTQAGLGNSTTGCHTQVYIVTLSESYDRMISRVAALALAPAAGNSYQQLQLHKNTVTGRILFSLIFDLVNPDADLDTEIERQRHSQITAIVK